MNVLKQIDIWLCCHSKRYKLHRICKAIGITPYGWQRDFALGKTSVLSPELRRVRQSGKTMAVILRVLMMDQPSLRLAEWILMKDPDYIPGQWLRAQWYTWEYRRQRDKCIKAEIPQIWCYDFRRIYSSGRERGIGL